MPHSFRLIDWKLVGATFAIMTMGLVAVYSALHAMPQQMHLFYKQLVAAGLGIVLMTLFATLYYNIYIKLSSIVYVLALLLLVGVLVFGKTVRGAKSWFDFGSVSFQPAECARLAIILILAAFIEKKHRVIQKVTTLLQTLVLVGVMMGLIVLQPDFGSMLVFIPVTVGMLYVAGASRIQLAVLLLYGSISAGVPLYATYVRMKNPEAVVFTHPLLLILGVFAACALVYAFITMQFKKTPVVWLIALYFIIGAGIGTSMVLEHTIKEYQRQRLVVFLNPELDQHGSGYNVIQSKVAVGSGGLFGKGLFSGTQAQLGFVPERHTDFIFSVIAEELGFVGGAVLITLFFIVMWRIYAIAKTARDMFGSLVATGICIMLCFYAVLNIGVVMGLMPVTGLPLPLVSYGGSSLVMTCIALGIVLNIGAKRHANI